MKVEENTSAFKHMLKLIEFMFVWRRRVYENFGRFPVVLPLVSLVYGVISAVYITRDFAHSSYLAASLGGMIVISVFLKIWFHGLGERWMAKWEKHLAIDPEMAHSAPFKTLVAHMAKPKVVESLVLQANQVCIQYITMFCIPLLYAAEAWGTLALTVSIAATSLWENWWQKLALQSWYGAAIRGSGAVLATSFCFAVLLPTYFSYFYPVMAFMAVVAVLPWSAFFPRRLPTLQEVAIVVAVVTSILLQVFTGEWMRVPVLSVWVRRPVMGLDAWQTTIREKWPRKISRATLTKALETKRNLCCVTPVVSPSGMNAKVGHEWLVNGERLELIALGKIRSSEKTETTPYRTYSCKQNFPPPELIQNIECRVYLDETVDIGGAKVVIVN